jgi:hypothetical protein
MRVGEFGGQIKFEGLVVLNNGITDLDGPGVTFDDNLLLKKWLDSGVHLFIDILNDDWVTHSDGSLENLKIISIGEFHDSYLFLLLHVLDPLVSLALWINEEWPSSRLISNDSVFNTECVIGKTE